MELVGSFSEGGEVHLLYELEYALPCIGNLKNDKVCVSVSEFYSSIWKLQVCIK
jgi:hypothetical protein